MQNSSKRVLSGMRSSNARLHLGNYEGALRNWVDLQNEGFETFCMVADLHALTTMYEEAAEVSRNGREVAKDFIAAGIDPSKSPIFIQSHVPEHSELHLLLSMITPKGWLERTPTYKEKVQDLLSGGPVGRVLALKRQLVAQEHHLLQARNACAHYATDAERSEAIHLSSSAIRSTATVLGQAAEQFSALNKVASTPQAVRTECLVFVLQIANMLKSLSESQEIDSFAASIGVFTEVRSGIEGICSKIDSLADDLAQLPYGLLGYPVLQTADILLYKPYGVPVGRDQAPHLEIGNDIGQRFNRIYGKDVFPVYKYLIPEDESRAKVPGTDADDEGHLRKMSKSYDNTINLADSEDEIAEKVRGAFTTPTKLRKTDPGIPEGCAVCQYLRLYSPSWKTQWEEDRAGERGCMQNKKELTEALNEFLRPMRERRKQIDDASIEEILRDGADRARAVAASTMAEVRDAMGLH